MPGYATITAALNPCDGSEERFASLTISLDNDGDGLTDRADPDCSPVANNPPVLSAIGNRSVNEGSLLSFTATATDPDAGQTRTFSLDAGAPAGAAINPSTGAFTWTPTEAQGPGSYPVTVRVTDNGSPAMSDFETITVTVGEVNVAPVLAPIGNRSGTVGSPVTFTATATDSDVPAQTRTFSLGAGAPAGAGINPTSGAFAWTPSAAGSFPVTVIVADNGTPSLNDSETITVTVSPAPVAPTITTSSPLPAGTVGTPYSQTFAATGGTTPYTWSVSTGLPAGLTFSAAGVLSGTPTAAGTFDFNVQVTGGGLSSTKTIALTINNVEPPTGAVSTFPTDGAAEVPVNTVIQATVAAVQTAVAGTTDIRALFNEDTFALKPEGASSTSSGVPAGPLLSDDSCIEDGVVQGSFWYDATDSTATFTPNCELNHGTTYVGTIAVGGAGALAQPYTWRFTTIASSPDSDEDGAEDREDDYPHDKRRSSRWSPYGTGKLQIDASEHLALADGAAAGGATLRAVKAISDTSARLNQAGRPAGHEFPDGLVSFVMDNVAPGSSAAVKVTFPSGIPAGSKVYQAGNDGFHEVAGAVVDGNTVTMTFTPPAGSTGQGNAIVVDPFGVATPAASGSVPIDLTTGGSSGGGCAVAGRAGAGGSGVDGSLILAALGLTLWRIRVRRKRT